MRPTVRRGFTLMELILVIALLGVVVAFAWPDFNTSADAQKFRESAFGVRGLVAMCRAEAMRQTLRYRLHIRQDGSLSVKRQADGLKAPQLYITPPVDWARSSPLPDGVWIESVQLLPEGPPPIQIIDQQLQFPELDLKPTKVEELEQPIDIDFDPSGTSNSVRLVLRDKDGRGILLTLDGRLGEIKVQDWERVDPGQAHRPQRLEPEKDPEYKPEDYQ